jgi:hypothetical protein
VNYPDLFLVNEAQMRVERFEEDVRTAQMLHLARTPYVPRVRARLARMSVQLAVRLDPRFTLVPEAHPK